MPRNLVAVNGALLLACALAGVPQPATDPSARIKIDVDRVVGTVDPLLFGNFAEHLGRMIYGGIYDEKSPLSDVLGYRRDVADAVRALGVSILRWPGGNFASGYDWKDGIGPKDQRPARPELAWNDVETNRFGTDEFLRYTQTIGAEPYICVNLGLGTIGDARDWVEYTNGTTRTYWADLRRRNGHEQPYGVKYWALGNEIDGPWQLGHKDADEYAKFALEAAKAMRGIDPSIKLVASGSSNYGGDWIGWNRTVLQTLRNTADYVALHTYINNRDDDFERYVGTAALNLERYIDTTASLIREVQTGPAPRPLYIAYDEWNVWYRTGNKEKLEEVYNVEDAVAMGVFFNAFFRHADVVRMANLAQMVNVIAPIVTNDNGILLQSIYFPIAEYGRQRGRSSLEVWVSAPRYRVPNRPQDLSYLDVSATYDAAAKDVAINVLNRSRQHDVNTTIELASGRWDTNARVWQIDDSDLKAANTFAQPDRVRPHVSAVTLDAAAGGVRYTFPAHSLTILRMKLLS